MRVFGQSLFATAPVSFIGVHPPWSARVGHSRSHTPEMPADLDGHHPAHELHVINRPTPLETPLLSLL